MKTTDEIMGLVEAYVLARCRFHDMSQSFTRQMGTDVKSTGDALCAALTASLDWHPMDSAPKDGTEVLAYAQEIVRMKWVEGEGYGLWIYADETLADVCPEAIQPTHWKPLPPPPAEGEK